MSNVPTFAFFKYKHFKKETIVRLLMSSYYKQKNSSKEIQSLIIINDTSSDYKNKFRS